CCGQRAASAAGAGKAVTELSFISFYHAQVRSSSASVHFLKKDRKEVPFLKRIVPKRNFPKWLG
ncbi:hypothetical protein MR657_05420, partial [bacterium]|nr:hypothetical protein [bacterium]